MTSGRLRTLATGLILAWFACAGALMPVLRGQADAAQLKSPTPATPESVAAGQKVYQRHCRVCHGADAKGRPGLEDGPAASNLAAKREASQAMGKAARIVKSIARHEKTIATMHGRVNEGREEVASWKSKYKAEKTKTDDMRIELIEATRKLSRQKLEHTTTGAHAAKYSDGLEDDIAMLSSQLC